MLTDKLPLCQREPEGMATPEPTLASHRHPRRSRNDGHNGRKTAPACSPAEEQSRVSSPCPVFFFFFSFRWEVLKTESNIGSLCLCACVIFAALSPRCPGEGAHSLLSALVGGNKNTRTRRSRVIDSSVTVARRLSPAPTRANLSLSHTTALCCRVFRPPLAPRL